MNKILKEFAKYEQKKSLLINILRILSNTINYNIMSVPRFTIKEIII